jgi:RNA polymerase sigma factor (sigma-70 family)
VAPSPYDIVQTARITRAEEQTQYNRIQQGSIEAVFTLAQLAAPLIRREMRAYREYRVDAEDLFSEGLMGAATAAQRFNPAAGTYFAFAALYIRDAINTYVSANAFPVAIPGDVFKGRPGREHLVEIAKTWADTTSLNAPAGHDGSLTVGEQVAGSLAGGSLIESRSIGSFTLDDTLAVREAVAKLTSQQQRLMKLTFLDGDMSGNDAAVEMGITKAGVAKTRARALADLKVLLEEP